MPWLDLLAVLLAAFAVSFSLLMAWRMSSAAYDLAAEVQELTREVSALRATIEHERQLKQK